jgi:hypothetical protein
MPSPDQVSSCVRPVSSRTWNVLALAAVKCTVRGVKVDDAWKALGQVNDWIRFADAKAIAVLAASGVLGGLLVRSIPRASDFKLHTATAILLSAAIVCIGASALITLRTLAPRLRAGEARSLLYFDHVARRYSQDRNAFVENFVGLGADEAGVVRQIADQVWVNSIVARRKFRRVSYAVVFLGLAMASSGAAVIVQRLSAR